jgi:hypothetical protein
LDVIAMEDYVAADKRPVDQCLADVASADLYIGLFAFRYGFIPEADNPEGRSITEMEYRHAIKCGIPQLIFRVPDKTMWRTDFLDAQTGDGDRGERIRKLREELGKEHLLSEFGTSDQLGEVVAAAAAKWLLKEGAIPAARGNDSAPVVAHPRQLRSDLLLLHTHADGASAAALARVLGALWKVETSATGLLAASADEFRELDRLVTSARSVAVLLSPSSLTVLAEDQARSRRTLGLARDRTDGLLGIALMEVAPDEAWRLTGLVSPTSQTAGEDITSLATGVHTALAQRLERSEVPEIGLPVVVMAMTEQEAADLLANPPEPVAALLKLTGGGDGLVARYGPGRFQWQPFKRNKETILQVMAAAAARANRDVERLQGRMIRFQPYPLDALLDDPLLMWPIYEDIARGGCLVVVDELSMFHRQVREAFARSPLLRGRQVAFVTLSPLDPGAGPPYSLLREQLDVYLEDATRRFGEVFDPLCELSIPERRRLDRWLYGTLPRTVEALREARRDPAKLGDFAEELGTRPNPAMGRLIAGERRPT